ncbi:MAG: AAA family ATPase, partial [Lachnospiraceae bacterium]|nr:AAA family ATPase [Lachnospiraceae bacterium]
MKTFLIDKFQRHNIPYPDCPIKESGFTRWGHNNKYWLTPVADGYGFGDWSTGERHFAFPDNVNLLSESERLELNRRINEERAKYHAEQQEQQKKVAETAATQFTKMVDAPAEHPYLARKQIAANNAKYNPDTQSLVVPLYDITGKLWTLQHIAPDGEKRFLPGGRKKGCFCPFGDTTDTIVVCEGFATASSIHAATGFYTVAAMDAGNLLPVASEIRRKYPTAKLIIAADNDWESENNTGVNAAAVTADETCATLCVPKINMPGMSDFNDIAVSQGLEQVKQQIDAAVAVAMRPLDGGYRVISAADFLDYELPPTEFLVYPLIPQNGLSLLYAERGAGKTFMAMAIACAAASGFDFLNFKAEKPRRVLYIDGEMDAREMQDRLNLLIAGFESDGKTVIRENMNLFLSGLQDNTTMPDLATPAGQRQIELYAKNVDLIIVDNIFSLYTAGRENDADSWQQFTIWSKKMRAMGKSILWLHHTGKDKTRGPRGSSAIEGILNTSIALEVSSAHQASDGAEVLAEYHKTRGVCGDDVRTFGAKLLSVRGADGQVIALKWAIMQNPQDVILDEIAELHAAGKTIKEIAKEIGVPKSTVHR